MGIADAFGKEDRVEITVSQLITLIGSLEREKAENRIFKRMLEKDFYTTEIKKVFLDEEEQKESED